MQGYIVEITFAHVQDDCDWREVQAHSRAEAVAVAETLFRREAWGQYRDPIVLSITAQELPERRYALRLDSDAEDLDVAEVIA